MNIFEMVKQLKSVQESVNRLKEELETETVTYEDEYCKITATLSGKVVEIVLKGENCKELEKHLRRAFEELYETSKKRVKEKTKSYFLGDFGLL